MIGEMMNQLEMWLKMIVNVGSIKFVVFLFISEDGVSLRQNDLLVW